MPAYYTARYFMSTLLIKTRIGFNKVLYKIANIVYFETSLYYCNVVHIKELF